MHSTVALSRQSAASSIDHGDSIQLTDKGSQAHQQTLLRLLGAPEHQEHRSAGTASGHPGMTKSATFWSGAARKVMTCLDLSTSGWEVMDLPDCI